MAVNGDEESLIELEGTGELLAELPHAFQQLIDDGRRLLRVPDLVVASEGRRGGVSAKSEGHSDPGSPACKSKPPRHLLTVWRQTCERTCVQRRPSLSL